MNHIINNKNMMAAIFAKSFNELHSVFAAVLEDAGVYKNTETGRVAFLKFVDVVNTVV